MSDPSGRVVLNCSVLARALINPKGPAGGCVSHILQGRLALFLSDYVLQELRELPEKIKPSRGVTPDRVEEPIAALLHGAEVCREVPEHFTHPVDPDDSHYVNLAIASDASHILTNDKHLLGLMDVSTATGRAFRAKYPGIVIATPEEFLPRLGSHA